MSTKEMLFFLFYVIIAAADDYVLRSCQTLARWPVYVSMPFFLTVLKSGWMRLRR
jgi:hypothetical protein